ncbi:YczE/YyaS/YitT family protein [Peribacillus loiseleuriae]|uniref:Membrane protein n=1 Tax=Peribacillus loiseleuriae TaxID=1679170 RepID=A0A0K9GUJ1_9BACI|nr:membrane protein [Peribacillus loiseleuriae]KMY50293.1 membrane protein [Peribacillus loiseleuriae]
MGLRFFRYFIFFLGLILFGLGNAIAVNVKFLGLHPWEVLNVAMFQRFGMTIGTWNVICGLILVFIVFIIDKRYISVGTFFNALLIGPIMDFFLWLNILPHATEHLWLNLLILLSGVTITGIGGGMYVACGFGAGPRDGFMLSVSDKTGLSVSRARIVVETLVLIIGFILGGPVFVMTFIYTFIQSPVFQYSMKIIRTFIDSLDRKQKEQLEVPL